MTPSPFDDRDGATNVESGIIYLALYRVVLKVLKPVVQGHAPLTSDTSAD